MLPAPFHSASGSPYIIKSANISHFCQSSRQYVFAYTIDRQYVFPAYGISLHFFNARCFQWLQAVTSSFRICPAYHFMASQLHQFHLSIQHFFLRSSQSHGLCCNRVLLVLRYARYFSNRLSPVLQYLSGWLILQNFQCKCSINFQKRPYILENRF